jgi:hypothetical protein
MHTGWLEIGTGNFIAPNREFIETSRDLQRLAGNCLPGKSQLSSSRMLGTA